MHRPGLVTWFGLAVVGTSAAVLTATTLRALALSCGFDRQLSWLLPVSVDAAGAVATSVWLTGKANRDAVRFARRLAWAAVGMSVLGNAAEHGLRAYGMPMPWLGVVAVSAIPPAVFGAVVHLAVLVGRPEPADTPIPSMPATGTALPVEGSGSKTTTGPGGPPASGPVVTKRRAVPDVDLEARALTLLEENPRIGRRKLGDHLGLTEHESRELLGRLRANVG